MARSPAVARCIVLVVFSMGLHGAFVGSSTGAPVVRGSRALLRAEEPSKSEALVKIDEDSTLAAASLLGGVAGFVLGGPWVALLGFVAAAAVSRKEDDDVAAALKGVGTAGLQSVNFVAGVADKYEVGKKVNEAVDGVKASSPEVAKALDSVGEAYKSVDQDINIKDTLGSIVSSSSSLAAEAVDKAGEVNDKYKITDQISGKVSEVVDEVQKTAKKA